MSNTVDVIIAAILFGALLKGFLQGFVKSILGPISLLAGLLIGIFYYHFTQKLIISLFICFIAPFFVKLILSLGLKFWRKTREEESSPSFLSRLLGGFFQVSWSGIHIALFIMLVVIIPYRLPWLNSFQNLIETSRAYALFRSITKDTPTTQMANIKHLPEMLQDEKKRKQLESSKEYQELMNDPRVRNILRDEALVKEIQNRNLGKVLSDPRIQSLLQDKELLGKFFALQKILLEKTSLPATKPQKKSS